MNKICFFSSFTSNAIFDPDNTANRDNCLYPFFLLKQELMNHGFDLSTQDINHPEDSEYILYLEMPRTLPDERAIDNSFLILFESEIVRPDNWDPAGHARFRKIFTWNDSLIDNRTYHKINFPSIIPSDIPSDIRDKTKLCTMIAGNKTVNHPLELYSSRVEAIRWFEQNHPDDFDLFGVGWDAGPHEISATYHLIFSPLRRLLRRNKPYPSYRGTVVSKKDVLQNYRYSICYENARDIPGYITEKIFDCFFAGCIPVYWGAGNVLDHIPGNTFIDKRSFQTYRELYDYISTLGRDDYEAYLEKIQLFLRSERIQAFSPGQFVRTIVSQIR